MNLDNRTTKPVCPSLPSKRTPAVPVAVSRHVVRLVVALLGLAVTLLAAAPAWAKGPFPVSHLHAVRHGASLAPTLVLGVALATPAILITVAVLGARRVPAEVGSLDDADEQTPDERDTRRAA